MLEDEPMSNDLTEYFAGTKLYGDDFSAKDIEACGAADFASSR